MTQQKAKVVSNATSPDFEPVESTAVFPTDSWDVAAVAIDGMTCELQP